jgi:hypothetical protein
LSAAAELLRRISEIGASVNPAGDKLIVRTGSAPIPADLVRQLRAAKAELLAALSLPPERRDAGWWRREFTIRTLDRLIGNRDREEAERLAFNDLVVEWHRQQGERVPRNLCAGCRRPLGSAEALDVIDGNRVHITDGYDCLIRHGERWRRAATVSLRAL